MIFFSKNKIPKDRIPPDSVLFLIPQRTQESPNKLPGYISGGFPYLQFHRQQDLHVLAGIGYNLIDEDPGGHFPHGYGGQAHSGKGRGKAFRQVDIVKAYHTDIIGAFEAQIVELSQNDNGQGVGACEDHLSVRPPGQQFLGLPGAELMVPVAVVDQFRVEGNAVFAQSLPVHHHAGGGIEAIVVRRASDVGNFAVAAGDKVVHHQLVGENLVVAYIAAAVDVIVHEDQLLVYAVDEIQAPFRQIGDNQPVQLGELLFQAVFHLVKLSVADDKGDIGIMSGAESLDSVQDIIEIGIGIAVGQGHDAADVNLAAFGRILVVQGADGLHHPPAGFFACVKRGIVGQDAGDGGDGNICFFCDFSDCRHKWPPLFSKHYNIKI